MTDFFQVFLISCICGLLFAAGAFLTAMKAGYLLDPARTQGQAPAFQVGYKGYSLSTGNALVALIVLALICILAVPLYVVYRNSTIDDHPVYLQAKFVPHLDPLNIVDDAQGTLHEVNLRLYKTDVNQSFTVSADPAFYSISIRAHFDWLRHAIVADVDNVRYIAPVQENQAEIPVVLAWTKDRSKAEGSVKGNPTRPKPVPAQLHNINDPVQVP